MCSRGLAAVRRRSTTCSTRRGCEHEPPGRDGLGYYVNEHDEPGIWLGRGAEALGLSGSLGTNGAGVLRELLDGRLGAEQLPGRSTGTPTTAARSMRAAVGST